MLSNESGGPGPNTTFDLPEEVLAVLPSDPFEQLDVARKITSIALSTRVSSLEVELATLRREVADRDAAISDLQSQLDSIDASFSDASDKLAQAEREKENLVKENAALSATVRKLNRDVAKLEAFRKTLMRSLQEEEDNPAGATEGIAARGPGQIEGDGTLPPTKPPLRSQSSDSGNNNTEDSDTEALRPRIAQGLLLASQTSTPRLTPPGSPPSLSASVSPTRSPKPISPPRRHSISFATTRGMFDDRSSLFSSMPSQHSSMSSLDAGSQSARTRVDGKEFFRQVRSRLSYEQFGAFLSNVKELNSHKQTKEDCLRKADEIFGPDNKDLYTIFEGLITRNVH
nr:uncharacterized protein At4g15545 isoform X1 [Ipomoea trifida]